MLPAEIASTTVVQLLHLDGTPTEYVWVLLGDNLYNFSGVLDMKYRDAQRWYGERLERRQATPEEKQRFALVGSKIILPISGNGHVNGNGHESQIHVQHRRPPRKTCRRRPPAVLAVYGC